MALDSQVQNWLMANQDKFAPELIPTLTNLLEKVKPEKAMMLHSIKLVDPGQIVLFAWLLSIDRFFLDDSGKGILKLVTVGGCGIWWLMDGLSAKKRAFEYNFKQFNNQIMQLT